MSTIGYTTNVTPKCVSATRPGDIFLVRAIGLNDQVEELKLRPVNYGVVGFDFDGTLQVIANPTLRQPSTEYTADGAIALTSGTHIIAKTSAAAMTVAAPTAAIVGTRLTISSGTNFAHVITFTGATLLDGTTGANLTVTLTAFIGSTIVVEARGTTWILVSSSNVTSITV